MPSKLEKGPLHGIARSSAKALIDASWPRRRLAMGGAFMVLSGAAALIYQVTWVRLLGLTMGSSAAAVATVLSAFFLGMALGSAGAARLARIRAPSFSSYAALELCIGAAGVLLVPILLRLDRLAVALPALANSTGLQFGLAMLVLALPAIAIGATFPILSAVLLEGQPEIGPSLGKLYGLNTLGAVLGAALSGFVLIPRLGLDGATYLAAALNAFVAGGALLLAHHSRSVRVLTRAASPAARKPRRRSPPRASGLALVALFITGFVAIGAEVAWTKYLSIFTGATIYGFSAILATVLLGMALGSALIHRHLARVRAPEWWLAAGFTLLAAGLLLTRTGMALAPVVYDYLSHVHATALSRRLLRYGFIFAVVLPPTLVFGALFPLNLKLYCGDSSAVSERLGPAYAVNTGASILGSLAAGFWLIPHYGTDRTLLGLALFVAASVLLFVPKLRGRRRTLALLAPVVLLAVGVRLPDLDYRVLLDLVVYSYDPDADRPRRNRYLYLKEAHTGLVAVLANRDGSVSLRSNGLQEASFHPGDPYAVNITETLLATLPAVLHPAPRSAFVIGFGGGTTAQVLTYSEIESIRVVELEPAIVEAVDSVIDGLPPALRDPRVRLEFNDARNTLAVDDRLYDVIVSQPSHPWIAGSGKLFTSEFFELVASRLDDNGIFGQWLNLFHMDSTTLRSILQAFYGVFPHGLMFANMPAGDLLLFGSENPILFDGDRIDERIRASEPLSTVLARHRIETAEGLLPYFALSRREALRAAGSTAPNTDTRILSEVRLGALDSAPEGRTDPYTFLRENYNFDLVPYLPPQSAARDLFDAGVALHEWGSQRPLEMTRRHLRQLDPDLAERLERRISEAPETDATGSSEPPS